VTELPPKFRRTGRPAHCHGVRVIEKPPEDVDAAAGGRNGGCGSVNDPDDDVGPFPGVGDRQRPIGQAGCPVNVSTGRVAAVLADEVDLSAGDPVGSVDDGYVPSAWNAPLSNSLIDTTSPGPT